MKMCLKFNFLNTGDSDVDETVHNEINLKEKEDKDLFADSCSTESESDSGIFHCSIL